MIHIVIQGFFFNVAQLYHNHLHLGASVHLRLCAFPKQHRENAISKFFFKSLESNQSTGGEKGREQIALASSPTVSWLCLKEETYAC